jgi:trans-aconitate 2-methyltransferase
VTHDPKDWDPGTYQRFRGLRLRPALDLLLRLGEPPEGEVVDLGCGDGAVAGPLRQVLPDRRIVGVDNSPAMIEQARGYDETRLAEIGHWAPGRLRRLIFSNAALQWLPHHDSLLPSLIGFLAPRHPGRADAPAVRRALAPPAARPGRGDVPGPLRLHDWVAPVGPPAAYHRLLSPLGEVDVWETNTSSRSTGGRGASGARVHAVPRRAPLRGPAGRGGLEEFLEAYDEALAIAYPAEADGRCCSRSGGCSWCCRGD